MAKFTETRKARRDLHYLLEGEGPFVTLVHGVGGSLGAWDGIAPRLARSFTVVRLDLRGHGQSSRIVGGCSLEDLAADVRHVWDELGIETTHVAGFSLGGLIAQSLALAEGGRIERLAIISAVAGRTPKEREKVQQRLAVLKEKGIGAVSAAAEERWFTPEFRAARPELVRQVMAELLANDPESYAAAYSVFATSDLGDRLSAISHPTLIVTGEHDVGSTARMALMMHARIATSSLVMLPGLRHNLLAEAPDRLAELLLAHFGAR